MTIETLLLNHPALTVCQDTIETARDLLIDTYREGGKLLLGSDRPGIGVEIDEKLAAKYPPKLGATGWTEMYLRDGSLHTP